MKTGYRVLAIVGFTLTAMIHGAGAADTPGFNVLRYDLVADRNVPELCFHFSGPLARQPDMPLENFVTVDPGAKFAAIPGNDRLCLTGFTFGTKYAVTLKPGLPGVTGMLAKEARYDIAFPNRPPAVAFATDGTVLPRLGGQTLTIRSVNVTEIAVDLFYISDRDVLQQRTRPTLTAASLPSFAPALGERVWQGTLPIKGEANRDAITDFAIETRAVPLKPGLYVAVAREPRAEIEPDRLLATQYFMVTDLGLTVYRSDDAIVVGVRSLATAAAAAAASVDVALIGENNRELARLRTDGSGFARFDSAATHGAGGDKPAAIYAYGAAGEFSVLDLAAAPLRLRGSDVATHPINGPVAAMIYPERDLYRPGETAQLTILARDDRGSAFKGPLTVKVLRPDSVTFESRKLIDQSSSAYAFPLELPPTGAAGTWTIFVSAGPENAVVGTAAIRVADRVLSDLTVALSADTALLDMTQPGNVAIQGQYEFGAPATTLAGELSVTLAPAANPFPGFPGFTFGLIQEHMAPVTLEPVRFTTDAKGAANQPLKLGTLPKSTKPLEARIAATVLDLGGQRIAQTIAVPVANQPYLFGLKPAGGADFAEGQTVRFDVIALGPDGARQEKPGAGWEIVREDTEYYWYRDSARWTAGATLHDAHIAGGMIDVGMGVPAAVEASLPPGAYRLEVFGPKGETASSALFHVGLWSDARHNEAPDSVAITLPKTMFAPGEGIDVFVKPPFEAEVTFAVADRSVEGAFIQHVSAAGGTIHIDMPRDVKGGGAHLLVTAFAPATTTSPPRRAIGAAWLAADPSSRLLQVKLEVPEKTTPQQILSVPITIAGNGDESVFVTVAAVDETILAATGFVSPNPVDFFMGETGLGIALHDLYGDIVGPMQALADDARSLDVSRERRQVSFPALTNRRLVSLYSGIVPVDKSGKVTIPFAIPEFEGKLRIMAVAWSGNRFGHADTLVSVRYPLAATLQLPDFLGPDDRADLTLALDNIDGPRGEYRISVAAEGAVSTSAPIEIIANLAEREQRNQPLQIHAREVGGGSVKIGVEGPGGISYERRLALPVKPSGRTVLHRGTTLIKPATALTIDPALLAGIRPETASLSVAISRAPTFDLNGMLREMAQGDVSVEQTASLGLLGLIPAAAIQSLGLNFDKSAADDRLKRALPELLGLQHGDGGFAPTGKAESDLWLTSYVLEFLSRAKAAGFRLPEDALTRGFRYLAEHSEASQPVVAANPANLEAAAYAYAVLAKNSHLDLSRLRNFADHYTGQMRSPLAVAWVGAAYAALGENAAASALFDQSAAMPKPPVSLDSYASGLRDLAARAAIVGESGPAGTPAVAAASFTKAAELAANRRRFSTQEAAWIMRAATAVSNQGEAFPLLIGDKTVSTMGAFAITTPRGDTKSLPAIKNSGTAPVYAAVTVTGIASPGELKDSGGFDIQRALFDRTGKPVDPNAIRQNDLLIVVLSGRFTGQGEAHPQVIDMLPAGWEIESTTIDKPGERFPWLKDVTGTIRAQGLYDRYVAVPAGDGRAFKLAYVVRAATRGQFVLPGTSVEDIVRPFLSGRNPGGRTKIDAPL